MTMFTAILDYEDPYVQPLIAEAFQKQIPQDACQVIQPSAEHGETRSNNNNNNRHDGERKVVQIRAYEAIEFEEALAHPDRILINAYIIRKALIRKHYLSNTVHAWITKHPDSVLARHFKPSVAFEVDYAEFLDEALLEAYELRESFERNARLQPAEREWWILKPSMTDRGQGIRLFSTEDELAAIFEQWDPPDSEDEDDDADDEGSHDGITTSQLRDFVAQPYIHPPLLLSSFGGRKFHIRTYVLAVGALSVYVYKPMLALFASQPYAAPWEEDDLKAHLTNTCLQHTGDRDGAVHAFWDLEDEPSCATSDPDRAWKDAVFEQICAVTADVFLAAAKNNAVHFQPLPNAFELFGLDFLVDSQRTVFLLEVNAFPDFKQTGDALRSLVAGLFEEVVDVAIKPFFGLEGGKPDGSERLRQVLDLDMGKR
ncbi:uncharacterized protein PV09_08577 [Verruconis gallopava]|uniref:Tubulin-tyrosine ligase n=1 Tax=Verruconis gallopava TaxID=253628 RepID=A0A0D1YG65_9PEZI|nr:uncharacterized protein PV09_08577 [Verruconis gallopava]KIV99771.1 hypothetical protein PV09_08577 [Verruconis gallopava]